MAKTPKIRPDPTANPRSRASRRLAASTIPSKRPSSQSPPPPISSKTSQPISIPRQSGGIQKKQRKKQPTRQQRARREKGLLRGEDVREKMEVKVKGSLGREKKGRERRKGWEDVNDAVELEGEKIGSNKKKGKSVGGKSGDRDGMQVDVEKEWVDDDEEDGVKEPQDGGIGEGEVDGDVNMNGHETESAIPADSAVAQGEEEKIT